MNIKSFHFLKTSKAGLFVLFIVSLFVFPVGGAFAFDRKEITQSLNISYIQRDAFSCVGGTAEAGVTAICNPPKQNITDLWNLDGGVSVKHVVEQVSPAGVLNKDDIVKYSYDPELPRFYFTTYRDTFPSGAGKWEVDINTYSFNILKDGIKELIRVESRPSNPDYISIWVYNYWTGVKPLVRMVSSNPAVLSCGTGSLSPLECVAVAAGSAEVRAEIGPTPLRIWLYGVQDDNSLPLPYKRFDGWVSEFKLGLFDGPFGYTLYNRKANYSWSETTNVGIKDYLDSHATAIAAFESWHSVYTSPIFKNIFFTTTQSFPILNQQMFALDLRISDIDAISVDAVASGISFKDALIKKYPTTIPIPVVTEFTPKNQANTLYLPPTTPNPPDDPWIVVVEEVKPNTTNPPTVNATNPLDVNLNSTVTIMATDNEGDDVKYCIDWNEDGDTIDLAVPSSDFNQDEGCLPSIGFDPERTTHTTLQSWKTVGLKTFQVRTLDARGGVSTWTSGMVTVPPPPLVCTENQSEDCTNTLLLGVCQAGTRTRTCSNNSWGSWGSCTALTQKGKEVCNGLDDDCDGPVDEGGVCTNGKSCVLNKRCERSRGENFLNCEDCRIEVKEVKAPFPNLWASLLGVFGKR